LEDVQAINIDDDTNRASSRVLIERGVLGEVPASLKMSRENPAKIKGLSIFTPETKRERRCQRSRNSAQQNRS
jgi:hypothetical protein